MNTTTRPRVIGYARLSKNPDGTIESVADQRRKMERYAEANGLDLVRIYSDDNRSAWRLDRVRKGWEAFLTALAETADLAGALSYHFDRLARNGRDGERFLAVMVAGDLALWTPQQFQDLGGDGDARMTFRILVAVAINQSDSTSRRVRFHKDERRALGNLRYVLGSNPPLGLRNGADDWETEPVAAAILADVAARVLADPYHRLPPAIADAVEAAGVPFADSLGEPANEKRVRAALRRPASAGLMTDRAGEVMSYEPVIANPPLDVATWRRLRAMFAGRATGRPADGDRYPLGPILRCVCGNQLTGCPIYDRRPTGEVRADGTRVMRVAKTTLAYACKNSHKIGGRTVKPCRRVSLPADDAHAVIRTAVEAWAEVNPDYLAARAAGAGTDSREAALNRALDGARADLADLFDMRRGMARDRYETARADLLAEVERLEADLASVAEVAATPFPASIDWHDMTAPEVRALVAEAVVTPITVRPGGRWVEDGDGRRRETALDRMEVTPR